MRESPSYPEERREFYQEALSVELTQNGKKLNPPERKPVENIEQFFNILASLEETPVIQRLKDEIVLFNKASMKLELIKNGVSEEKIETLKTLLQSFKFLGLIRPEDLSEMTDTYLREGLEDFVENLRQQVIEIVKGNWPPSVYESGVLSQIPEERDSVMALFNKLSIGIKDLEALFQTEKEKMEDPLTGLPNRLLFQGETVREYMKLSGLNDRRYKSAPILEERRNTNITTSNDRRENNERGTILALFDIDKFKLVNDTYGHNHGDDVIKLVGEKLKEFKKKRKVGATIGRHGGEEFTVSITLYENDGITEEPKEILAEFHDSLRELQLPYPNEEEGMHEPKVSVGATYLEKRHLSTLVAHQMVNLVNAANEAAGNKNIIFESIDDLKSSMEASEFREYTKLASGVVLQELIRRADESLYEAKEGGRNKTYVNEESSQVKDAIIKNHSSEQYKKTVKDLEEILKAA